MQLEELIEVVKKKQSCDVIIPDCERDCDNCEYALTVGQVNEMYADILMRLKQEKWAIDKMEELQTEERIRFF